MMKVKAIFFGMENIPKPRLLRVNLKVGFYYPYEDTRKPV